MSKRLVLLFGETGDIMKITKFSDIPKLTDVGHYSVDISLNYLVRNIEEWQEEMNLQLCPDFQRGYVWTEEQQISFIEFFLRGGKTGRDLYFNCPSWHCSVNAGEYNDFVCVDGLQRLTAITRFIKNEIPVFGSFYCEFEDSLRMSSGTMKVYVNDLKTKREVLKWYIEMNTGGTVHTNDEIERVHKLMDECK